MNPNAFAHRTDHADATTAPEIPMHATDRSHATTTTTPSTPEIAMPATDPTNATTTPPSFTTSQETPMHDHADSTTTPSITTHDTTPPASAERPRAPRVFEPRLLRKPLDRQDLLVYAEDELDWLHSPAAESPRHAARRAVLLGWLERLSGLHRGILALAYDDRSFSLMIARAIGLVSEALVVRVDCAAHPMQGTVEEAERASVARLEALIREGKKKRLVALEHRAGERLEEAVEAFAKVRGNVAECVPRERSRRVTKKPATTPGDATA